MGKMKRLTNKVCGRYVSNEIDYSKMYDSDQETWLKFDKLVQKLGVLEDLEEKIEAEEMKCCEQNKKLFCGKEN